MTIYRSILDIPRPPRHPLASSYVSDLVRFKDLPVGTTFRFVVDSYHAWPAAAEGQWIKVSAKRAQSVESKETRQFLINSEVSDAR